METHIKEIMLPVKLIFSLRIFHKLDVVLREILLVIESFHMKEFY